MCVCTHVCVSASPFVCLHACLYVCLGSFRAFTVVRRSSFGSLLSFFISFFFYSLSLPLPLPLSLPSLSPSLSLSLQCPLAQFLCQAQHSSQYVSWQTALVPATGYFVVDSTQSNYVTKNSSVGRWVSVLGLRYDHQWLGMFL